MTSLSSSTKQAVFGLPFNAGQAPGAGRIFHPERLCHPHLLEYIAAFMAIEALKPMREKLTAVNRYSGGTQVTDPSDAITH